MALEERAPEIARKLEAMTGRTPSHSAVVAFLGVQEDFLHTAFAEIEATCGSVDAYLSDRLGLDAAARERIGERLCA